MALGHSRIGAWMRTAVILSALAFGASAAQAAETWSVDRARGTVFQLVDGKWRELDTAATLEGEQVVRTMAGGLLKMTVGDATVELAGGTAVQYVRSIFVPAETGNPENGWPR